MPTPRFRSAPNAGRAAVLVLAVLAAVLLAPGQGSHVVSLSGDVEIGRGEPPVFTGAEAGEALSPGDVVRTGGDGRAELDLGRATLRLYPNSLLRVPDASGALSTGGEAQGVQLDRGRSLFDVLRGADPFEVRTPEVVVSVKGTRFSVALDDDVAAVAVFRGLVGVRSTAAAAAFETLVREGFVAQGRDSFELSLLEGSDPWEAWGRGGQLPELPRPALERMPRDAEATLREARSAALEDARGEAVLRAAERHPEVAAELTRLREKAGEPGDAAEELDGVQDGRREKRERALEESYVETFMNGSMDPGGAAAPVTFSLSFLDGSGVSGDDTLHIDASDGSSWDLDEGALEDVLDGQGSLPASLSTLLGSQGMTDEEFAKSALMLFD